ncbi:hypothetical protein [Anaeromyxobacter sp. Fw109-5]|uniref:hypothetical protein n=1 Tax=Anaeromyxobacter sp. (strain Fw109-5) TaxID=404589 RepID=UPI0000ED7813|nr:hypothetical protein [Anaeromyxobacter sp. Fw109-5]ABS24807.1 hypothetical protein Anae109_0593 [Anaeromyxobacter sp. Fw109-5]
MRPRVARKRSDGIIQIRRRRPSDALLTRDVARLGLLMGGWALFTAALVGALLLDVGVTSLVILLGIAGVSAAVAMTRAAHVDEAVHGAPTPPPPPGRAG